MLPTDAQDRKDTPVYSGFVCYFPLAMAEVSRLSKAGNDQHNPGKPLHWDRDKSGDELDALTRHLLDGAIQGDMSIHDSIIHARAVAWRAMADLQKLCERQAVLDAELDAQLELVFEDWNQSEDVNGNR